MTVTTLERPVPMVAAADERMSLRFASGSEVCHAWLYLPPGASQRRPVPVVVMAHGLGGVKQIRLGAYAERFRAAGYACLVFDYRYLGESTGEPRALVNVRRQLEDWRAAVSFARSLPEIDPERVILWGTSFAGGHVIVTAAEDPRIAAAISQCPFTDGPATGRVIDLRTKVRLTARALRDVVAKWFGMPPVRVPLVGRPGDVAILTTADAVPGFQALLQASGMRAILDLPARIVLQLLRYRPGRWAKDVRCPILFCICESDSVAPASTTIKHVQGAQKGEIKRYPEGHFEIYLGQPMQQIVDDQIAFLKAHVPNNA